MLLLLPRRTWCESAWMCTHACAHENNHIGLHDLDICSWVVFDITESKSRGYRLLPQAGLWGVSGLIMILIYVVLVLLFKRLDTGAARDEKSRPKESHT